MFIGLDLETTGLNPQKDHIIEVGIIRFDHERILEEWSSLVKPPIPIPAFTTHLTGITSEMVSSEATWEEILPLVQEKLGSDPVVGHFIAFDTQFLKAKGVTLNNVELDTCQLAQAFLPNESSYSLEVLAQKLGIVQTDAHRALNDVRANIELFWKFCAHVKALTQKEKKAIRPILEKSDWPWTSLLLPLLDGKGGKRIKEEPLKKQETGEEHAELYLLAQELSPPFLLEEGSHTTQDLLNYALKLNGKTLLVLPNPEALSPHKDLGILKHPSQYLDEQRFSSFLSKTRLNTMETLLGIKIQLWLLTTKTGERSHLRLQKGEKDAWFDLCCQEADESQSFYAKAEKAAQRKKVMAISSLYFLRDRSRKDPLLPPPQHLLIGEAGQLVKTMEEAWHIRLSESRFLQDLNRLKQENPSQTEIIDQLALKVSILFGFLEMMIKKEGVEPQHTLLIETHHLNTLEWNKVKGSAKSIEAAAAGLGDACKKTPTLEEFHRYLTYLAKILRLGAPVLWLTLSKEDQAIVHAFPENPTELFSERVWKDIKDLRLFCHHGNVGDDFAFLKKDLGLPEGLTAISKKEVVPLPLYYPSTPIKNPNDAQNVSDVLNELQKWLPKIQGNSLVLVTSMAAAEQFFYKFAKTVKEWGLTLFVQNLSGGMGKIAKMAEKTDGKNVFVGNEGFMNFLLEESMDLKFLAVHRIPFVSPENPIQKARGRFYQDPYKNFTLPQASLRYHSLLNRFLGNAWEAKQILILDPRAQNSSFFS